MPPKTVFFATKLRGEDVTGAGRRAARGSDQPGQKSRISGICRRNLLTAAAPGVNLAGEFSLVYISKIDHLRSALMFLKQLVACTVKWSKTVCACWAVAAVLACGVNRTLADDDDIVNAGGFELPFTTVFGGTGQLEGQINPPGEGQVISPGQWLRTQGGGSSSAVVQSTVFAPGGGTQAVRVDRGANSDSRWAVPVNALGYPDYPNPFPPEPAQPLICISWDMRVEQSPIPVDGFAPLFGVEAYDDDGNPVALMASLLVDSGTGDVLYQAQDTGFLTETGSAVAFGAWNRFHIELDYSTHLYELRLNNTSLGTFGFVDQNNVVGGLNQFSDADIAALAGGGDPASLAATGTAYFDNYLVREGMCIPEPAAAVLAAMGIGGLYVRRRPERRRT
jgi:hypothetical protein